MLSHENTISILNKSLNQRAKIRKGTDAVYFCPICKHGKRKLEINLITGKYHCWVCNLSGLNLSSLFKKLNIRGQYFPKLISKPHNEKSDIDNLFSETSKVDSFLNLPPEFKPLYEPCDSIEYKNALRYMTSRLVSDIDIKRYKIGYCESGEFSYRIIIPSFDKDNKLNFFVGRSYYTSSKLKYNNCRFNKDMIGFESVIDFNQEITLVEGAFDAISVRYNCIPLFGKVMSSKLKLALLSNSIKMVNILLDDDAAKDALRIAEFLFKNGIPSKVINLGGKDPSEIGFEKTWDIINNSEVLTFDSLFRFKLDKNYECNKT